ncbi:hypothetical protein JI57_01965 [Psychromonas sp. PRT-SC03]|nr:hypothetical protein JI57_01965 [Psychromonas sp. PRT-SC03]
MKKIMFFKTEAGKSPIEDFLETLNEKQLQKVLYVLKVVRELDDVPATYFKKLTNTKGIWEVRVIQGGNIFRLLGFVEDGNLIILSNAFQKKTQKTPKKEIKLAEKRKIEYLKRKNSEASYG